MAEAWPLADFPLTGLRWRPQGNLLNSGRTILGPGQVGGGLGWWQAEFDGTQLAELVETRKYKALLLRAGGGDTPFEVPYIEETTPAGYTARFGAAASRGANQVQIQRQSGFSAALALGGPQAFTVVHAAMGARLYLIEQIVSTAGDKDTVKVWPTLRESVALNAAIDFNNPRCLMRIDDPEGDAWPRFDGRWFGDSSPRFVEWPDEAP